MKKINENVKEEMKKLGLLNEDHGQSLRGRLLYNKISVIMNQEFKHDISFSSQKLLSDCIKKIVDIEDK